MPEVLEKNFAPEGQWEFLFFLTKNGNKSILLGKKWHPRGPSLFLSNRKYMIQCCSSGKGSRIGVSNYHWPPASSDDWMNTRR